MSMNKTVKKKKSNSIIKYVKIGLEGRAYCEHIK